MGSLLGVVAAIGGFIIIIVLAIYIVEGIFLYKLNKLMYGKGTALAWIPICNTYLLGKLTINKIVGWILVACVFLTANFTLTINGVQTTKTLIPQSLVNIISPIYSFVVLGLFIYAIVKYFDLKKKANPAMANTQNVGDNNIPTNPIEPSVQNNSNMASQAINPQPSMPTQSFNNEQINSLEINNQNAFSTPSSQAGTPVNGIQENQTINSTPDITAQPTMPSQEPTADSIFNSNPFEQTPTQPNQTGEKDNFINQG